ncbi:D-arabinose 1-dehydrogenase (NAD(+)) [Malassezia cuniculi]|uniref:D-arabinose 1-dehydrogenase (NAD(+)) n=1 Tax=Malassezia cuniculi TaxID=948313 RepID=A0AAF0ET94_9BASI|nr:D-arabinose 1-dehydrogenase (NAD(+)) [Malassezia cuniculi]
MPVPPSTDPPLESFGPIKSLSELPIDKIRGSCPWTVSTPPLTDLRKQCSPLVFGGGVFGLGMYNPDNHLYSDEAVRALRLAFQYGINTLDSSPYYFPSEFVLGRALRILAPEFPRESYMIITKCGRYGPQRSMFDYSPERVEASIRQSCSRLGVSYLDGALLHDAEFVSDQPEQNVEDAGFLPAQAIGAPCAAKTNRTPEEAQKLLGISPEDAATIRGPGDEKVLAAVRKLFELKDQGLVRNVGISGYPLPELLRIVRLVASNPPFRPLDIVLSYSNNTVHSKLLPMYRAMFESPVGGDHWVSPLLLNASPFSMGLFSDRGAPNWHPADKDLVAATRLAHQKLKADALANPVSGIDPNMVLAQMAMFSGIQGSGKSGDAQNMHTLVGMSNVDEVHAAISVFRVLSAKDNCSYPGDPDQGEGAATLYNTLERYAKIARAEMEAAGVNELCWQSPPQDA